MKKRTYVKPEITVYLMHTAPTLLAGSDINQSIPQFGIKISFKKFGNLNYFSYLCRC